MTAVNPTFPNLLGGGIAQTGQDGYTLMAEEFYSVGGSGAGGIGTGTGGVLGRGGNGGLGSGGGGGGAGGTVPSQGGFGGGGYARIMCW